MNPAVLNVGGVVLALTLSAAAVTLVGQDAVRPPEPASPAAEAKGPQVVVDARGRSVPTAAYQRIVSLHSAADAILLDMVEPARLVGITYHTLDNNPIGFRFGNTPGIQRSQDIERVLVLRPDLVVVSKFVGDDYVTRIRENGVEVFDLGEMRGVQDTLPNVRSLAALLELTERGERIASHYARNLAALEAAVADRDPPWGIYLTVLGDSFFGGSAETSYGDLLHYGGVRDLAAARGFSGWPRYSPEQLVSLNPSLIVTSQGRSEMICSNPLLERLAACQTGGRIIEMPAGNHSDPGLGLVDAAQDLQTLIHGIEPSRAGSNALGKRRPEASGSQKPVQIRGTPRPSLPEKP
ncbi:MAG: ABC transporter substrate-binding protein [Myxococcota bacterium]